MRPKTKHKSKRIPGPGLGTKVRRRRGYSLIEALLTVTLTAMVLAMTVPILFRMFGFSGEIKRDGALFQTVSQLSCDFREHVHQSEEIESHTGDEPKLTLRTRAGTRVEYRWLEDTLVRQTFAAASSKNIAAEYFVFPAGSHIELQVSNQPEREQPIATLTLDVPWNQRSSPAQMRRVVIAACVGTSFQSSIGPRGDELP